MCLFRRELHVRCLRVFGVCSRLVHGWRRILSFAKNVFRVNICSGSSYSSAILGMLGGWGRCHLPTTYVVQIPFLAWRLTVTERSEKGREKLTRRCSCRATDSRRRRPALGRRCSAGVRWRSAGQDWRADCDEGRSCAPTGGRWTSDDWACEFDCGSDRVSAWRAMCWKHVVPVAWSCCVSATAIPDSRAVLTPLTEPEKNSNM